MGRKINYSHRQSSALLPTTDIGALLKEDVLKEHIKKAKPKDRAKMLAFLYSIYSSKQLSDLTGYTAQTIRNYARLYPEIVEASQLSRNLAIADLTERRVVELLQKMNVDNIPDEKKPQSVKYLMDSADLARGQTKEPTDSKDEDVMTLVYKVEARMKRVKAKEPEAIEGEVIDAEIIEEKKKRIGEGSGAGEGGGAGG